MFPAAPRIPLSQYTRPDSDPYRPDRKALHSDPSNILPDPAHSHKADSTSHHHIVPDPHTRWVNKVPSIWQHSRDHPR